MQGDLLDGQSYTRRWSWLGSMISWPVETNGQRWTCTAYECFHLRTMHTGELEYIHMFHFEKQREYSL